MLSPQTVLAFFMLKDPRRDSLKKVKDWMFTGEEKKLFRVLEATQEKEDLVKLRELSGCKAGFIADMSVLASEVMVSDITNEDIEIFVIEAYKNLITKYTKAGELGKVQKVLEMLNEEPVTSPAMDFLDYEEEIATTAESGLLGMSTGIPILDLATYGLIPGQIWVCGGYYGYGKTYFMLNLVNAVIGQGKRVLVFSLEMSRNELLTRLMCLTAELGSFEFFRPLDKEKDKRRNHARDYWLDAISTGQLVIDEEMRSSEDVVARIATSKGVDFVCLDYIQLLSTGPDQYEGLREAMKAIQMVTKRYRVTTLLLSQISNQSQREGYNASVDGFKGAGDIGQVANVAMRIRRERDELSGEWDSAYGLHITKIRHAMPSNLALTINFPGGLITQKSDLDI